MVENNTYNLLKLVENNSTFLLLLRKGIVPLSVLDRKCYYERFLQEFKAHNKTQAITNTAEEFRVSERTIYNTIKLMES